MAAPGSVTGGIGGNGNKNYGCAACGTVVTSADRVIAVDGGRKHRFVNPAGVECELYTFSACPGATTVGPAVLQHTWFTGYRWRLAFCAHCGEHLGWRYETVTRRRPAEFWGLIVSGLKENQSAYVKPEESS
jgi:hypothetical protein